VDLLECEDQLDLLAQLDLWALSALWDQVVLWAGRGRLDQVVKMACLAHQDLGDCQDQQDHEGLMERQGRQDLLAPRDQADQ